MQHGLKCGAGELKIIATILHRPVIEKILKHLGLEREPPRIAPARSVVPHLASG